MSSLYRLTTYFNKIKNHFDDDTITIILLVVVPGISAGLLFFAAFFQNIVLRLLFGLLVLQIMPFLLGLFWHHPQIYQKIRGGTVLLFLITAVTAVIVSIKRLILGESTVAVIALWPITMCVILGLPFIVGVKFGSKKYKNQ